MPSAFVDVLVENRHKSFIEACRHAGVDMLDGTARERLGLSVPADPQRQRHPSGKRTIVSALRRAQNIESALRPLSALNDKTTTPVQRLQLPGQPGSVRVPRRMVLPSAAPASATTHVPCARSCATMVPAHGVYAVTSNASLLDGPEASEAEEGLRTRSPSPSRLARPPYEGGASQPFKSELLDLAVVLSERLHNPDGAPEQDSAGRCAGCCWRAAGGAQHWCSRVRHAGPQKSVWRAASLPCRSSRSAFRPLSAAPWTV